MNGGWCVGMGLTWNIKGVDYESWHEMYMHDKYYLAVLSMIGIGSVRNFLEISRWDLKVVLQWSGRNSMTPVSGDSWWCPICIINVDVWEMNVIHNDDILFIVPINPKKMIVIQVKVEQHVLDTFFVCIKASILS